MEVPKNLHDSVKETSRVESFSDGVFAIAITLLILDIHIPEVKANESLLHSLTNEWPGFLALLIGFFTILICWINHHYMFQMINKSNSTLLLLNGFKLLIVTTTPIATAILSKNMQTEWQQTAVNIYCFNFALMGTAMMIIWWYSARNGLVKAASANLVSAVTKLYIFAGIFSTLIWIVSFFNITACLILSGIMFAIFISPKKSAIWLADRTAIRPA